MSATDNITTTTTTMDNNNNNNKDKNKTKNKKKKDRTPKVPDWWMEITPHDVLYREEDEAARKAEYEEKLKFAQLAAEQDWLQKYGGEGFPDWNPTVDGPRTPEEEEEWITQKGYKRDESNNNHWVDEDGQPLDGRQFKGKLPAGYVPGQFKIPGGSSDDNYNNNDGRGGRGSGGKYERDRVKTWDKPDWMKVKLRSTTGRKGETIVKGDGNVVSKTNTNDSTSDEPSPTEATTTAAVDVASDQIKDDGKSNNESKNDQDEGTGKDEGSNEGNNHMTDTTPVESDRKELLGEIKSAASFKPRATGELQAILNRRKEATD